RGGVDEDLHAVAIGVPDEAAERLELRLHQIVIVAALGVDRDGRALRLIQHRQRIGAGTVVQRHRDDGPRLGPQRARVGALIRAFGEPAHVALPALLDELAEPFQPLGAGVGRQRGAGEANGVEAEPQRFGANGITQLGGIRLLRRPLGNRRALAHRLPLSPSAVGRHALAGQPQALGRLAGLPEHVDGHAAARIPVAADAQPARRQLLHQPLADSDRRLLVEALHVAKAAEIELERLALDQLGARRVVDHEMGEVGLAGDRAQRGEFGRHEAYQEERARIGRRHRLEQGLVRRRRGGRGVAELAQMRIFRHLAIIGQTAGFWAMLGRLCRLGSQGDHHAWSSSRLCRRRLAGLRVSLHSDLKIIDPIWTTALISTHHGHMIYDTLFAVDEHLQVKPQMVDSWTVSPDKLTWTFKLRDGLEWSDGKPVTGEDCVASIRRWGAKDGMGQKLMSEVASLTAPDAKTITMVLKEPYGLVLESLGKSSSNVAFMMPKRVADTDPNSQITDTTGSGPFIFKKDEWKPGEKAVYVRNPHYKPRNEPASGLAGGKVAKVDRVEWITIADQQTQVNALLNGEIDLIEIVPPDLLPLLQKDKNIKIFVTNLAGRQYAMRFNVLYKPFDNAKIRQATLYALDQKPFLEANVGNPEYYKECRSLFPCGSPLESTKGWDDKLRGNVAKAKELLKEAGYDGTPFVMLHQTDTAGHNQLATVAKPQLEAAGFKVDLQAMDWQTLVSRRNKRDPLDKGG